MGWGWGLWSTRAQLVGSQHSTSLTQAPCRSSHPQQHWELAAVPSKSTQERGRCTPGKLALPQTPCFSFSGSFQPCGLRRGQGNFAWKQRKFGISSASADLLKTTSLLWAIPFEMGWKPAGSGEGKVSHLQLLPPSLRRALHILGLCHPSLPTRAGAHPSCASWQIQQ